MARQNGAERKGPGSQSTAARRRLTLGDIVRVKDGVMDPDYDGYRIGGWSGTIIAFETWEQTPMALIEWDTSTQRDRIDPEVRRRAASQGLSAADVAAAERMRTGGGGQRGSALRGAAQGSRG